jgi:tripartite-type tricarboxylate transporter receptor subunit TctC
LREGRDGVALDAAAAQVRDNHVRSIFITGLEHFTAFPDIPTLVECGTTWQLGECH